MANAWEATLRYFAAMDVGDATTRKHFMATLGTSARWQGFKETTLDTYRCYLQRAGYLRDPSPKRGFYVLDARPPTRVKAKYIIGKAYGAKRVARAYAPPECMDVTLLPPKGQQ